MLSVTTMRQVLITTQAPSYSWKPRSHGNEV